MINIDAEVHSESYKSKLEESHYERRILLQFVTIGPVSHLHLVSQLNAT
jgi:hypothetical protein